MVNNSEEPISKLEPKVEPIKTPEEPTEEATGKQEGGGQGGGGPPAVDLSKYKEQLSKAAKLIKKGGYVKRKKLKGVDSMTVRTPNSSYHKIDVWSAELEKVLVDLEAKFKDSQREDADITTAEELREVVVEAKKPIKKLEAEHSAFYRRVHTMVGMNVFHLALNVMNISPETLHLQNADNVVDAVTAFYETMIGLHQDTEKFNKLNLERAMLAHELDVVTKRWKYLENIFQVVNNVMCNPCHSELLLQLAVQRAGQLTSESELKGGEAPRAM